MQSSIPAHTKIVQVLGWRWTISTGINSAPDTPGVEDISLTQPAGDTRIQNHQIERLLGKQD